MLALYEPAGRPRPLRAYTEVRDRLVDELGIDPGSALRELRRASSSRDSVARPARRRPSTDLSRRRVEGQPAEQLSSFVGRTLSWSTQPGSSFQPSRDADRPRRRRKDPAGAEWPDRLQDIVPGGAWLVELAGIT